LDRFVEDFVKVVEKHCKYVVVSGFVAIAHGRSRGTEDVDLIIERISESEFASLLKDLAKHGFECIQPGRPQELFKDYLREDSSIRFVRKNAFIPEMELKMAKDQLDDYQIKKRVKLPLTGLNVYYSSIETNIAFKEHYLKSDKDLEDARHLRIVYAKKIDEKEVNKIKNMIRKYRLK
jgi:hypothetical protein